MIDDKISGKQKGYAFIEFENEKDMHCKFEIVFATNCFAMR